jgi:hypothetical protein
MKNLLLLLTLVLLVSCGEDDSSNSTSDGFDRANMLTNWSNNIIIPAYTDFQSNLASLKVATTDFTTSQSQENLNELRNQYLQSYKTWQYIVMFSSVGKANELDITRWVNLYPTDNDLIESNVVDGNVTLSTISTNTQQGFPALDYLLYGVANTDNDILTKFNSDNYQDYLTKVVDRLIFLNDAVLNDWNNGYKNVFISSSENTSGSSVNIMVNDFVFNYEKYFRAYKLGNPLAVFGGDINSQEVESLYGKHSKELCLSALNAIEDFFNGKYYSSTVEGESLKSYLTYLNTKSDGEALAPIMLSQMDSARTNINLLDSDFATQIDTDSDTAYTTYDEIQKLVPMLKVDMMQAFNISGDYQDSDGD